MGINMNEAFPSKWLKASDIEGDTPVSIANVTMEDVGDDDRKPVVWLHGYQKGLVLNKTNANNISELYGPDTDAWIGKPMTMATAMVDFQGKSMRALRLYPPARGQVPAQPAPQDYDDRNPPPITEYPSPAG